MCDQPFVWLNAAELNSRFKHRQLVCLFFVVSALLLCGDVESNPGPSDELNEILNEIRAQEEGKRKQL